MIYIACLKYGNKYGPKYVNILKNMISRHLSLPHKFICFTENTKGLDPEIQTIDLPDMGLSGEKKAWWYKLKAFDKDLPLKGTLLFLDLDLVIISNIDRLFEYQSKKFCIIQDFHRIGDPNYPIKNSSVFRLELGTYSNVWDDFIKFKEQIVQGFQGDQDWISAKVQDAILWPHDWIISYRWELKMRLDKDPSKHISYSDDSQPPRNCSIIVFHGEPSPHHVVDLNSPDPLIKRHWH